MELDDRRARGADLVGERGHQARLADARVAAEQHAGGGLASPALTRAHACAELLQLGVPLDQRGRPRPPDRARRSRTTRNGWSGSRDALDDLRARRASISNRSSTSRRTSSETTTVPGLGERRAAGRRRWRRGRRRRPRRGRGRRDRGERRHGRRATRPSVALVAAESSCTTSHEREPGPHRPLGVVLVRDREPEDRQAAVALELDDVALEARLDDVAARGVVAAHELPVGLGLQPSGELGGADDVAEHDREPAQLAGPER